MEGNRVVPVGGVENGRLRIESYVRAQSQPPAFVLHQIANSAEGVGTDAERWLDQHWGKQFVFVDEFETGVGIVPAAEVQRGLQQVAVQIVAGCDLADPPPNE